MGQPAVSAEANFLISSVNMGGDIALGRVVLLEFSALFLSLKSQFLHP